MTMNRGTFYKESRNLRVRLFLLSTLLLSTINSSLGATTNYIRAGASGGGTSWTDAMAWPASMTRDRVYLVGDGDFSSRDGDLNDALDGTKRITIQKATVADHGTATGWSDSYAAQARLPAMAIWKDYYTIDGAYRGSDPRDFTGYGFCIKVGNGICLQASASNNQRSSDVVIARTAFGNIAQGINYIETNSAGIYVVGGHNFNNWRISSNLFKWIGLPIQESSGASCDWVIENNYMAYTWNKIAIRINGNGASRWHIRNNNFLDCCLLNPYDHSSGQTTLIGSYGVPNINDHHIYGNIVHVSDTYAATIMWNDAIISGIWNPGDIPYDSKSGWKIYNNIFSHLGYNTGGGKQLNLRFAGAGFEVYNNVWINCSPDAATYVGVQLYGTAASTAIVSNNWVYPNGNSANLIARSASNKSGSADPFIDSMNDNFYPKDPATVSGEDIVDGGRTLPGTFGNVDPLGVIRGSGGAGWDIGAFEYAGSCTTPPTITSSTNLISVTNGVAYAGYTINAVLCAPATYGASNLPTGLSRSSSFISGTPNQSGAPKTNVVLISVTNSFGVAQTNLVFAIYAADLIAPTVPTGLACPTTNSTSVFLTWNASTDAASGVSYYIIRKGGVSAGTSTSTSGSVSGLNPETAYCFTVSAVDLAGNESAQSSPSLCVTTRSGPAIPIDFALWFDAGVGVTLNGSTVSQWNDQSQNIRDATQATAGSQPAFVSSAVNGLPALLFDGSDDFLTFNFDPNNLTHMSIFLVANNTSSQIEGGTQAERAAIFWNETASWGTIYLSPWQTKIAARIGNGASGSQILHTRPASISTGFSITSLIKSSSTVSLFTNQVQAAFLGDAPFATANCQAIGNLGRGYNNNTYFAGHIAEVIVYTRSLSAGEKQAVEGYLNTKYFNAATPTGPNPLFTGTPLVGTNTLTVAFTNQSSGTFTNALWTFGDGTTTNTTALSFAHLYTAPGFYDVTLRLIGNGITNSLPKVQYVQVANPSAPTVTVTAVGNAAEPMTGAPFLFTRTSDSVSQPLNVNFTVTGTAISATDFYSIGDVAHFAADATETSITVVPIDDTAVEAPLSITVTITAGSGYTIGEPSEATMLLTSDDTIVLKQRGLLILRGGKLKVR